MQDAVKEKSFPTISITMIGEEGSGKTSIQRFLAGKSFQEQISISNGANYRMITDQTLAPNHRLRLCDISGNASFEIVRRNYMMNSDGAILVFDLTKSSSFSNAINWLKEYLIMNENKDLPILIIGNKSDLEHREVSLKEVREFLHSISNISEVDTKIVGYIETSAKDGTNIREGIRMLTETLTSDSHAG